MKRIDSLTGIRALAVVLVFIYHNKKYWHQNLHPEIIRIITEFHVGVSFFFVLSGFLIGYIYEDNAAKSRKAYFNYLVVRMARIFPLYWFILTLYYLDPRFGNYKFSLLTYTLTHGFSNKLNLNAIAQSWSLSVEFSFYLLAPFLFLILKKSRWWLLFFIISLFGLFNMTGLVWEQIDGNPNQFFSPFSFLLSGTFPGRASEFVFGMILAWSFKNKKLKKLYNSRNKTIVGFIGTFISLYGMGMFQDKLHHHGYEHPVGRLISIAIIPAFITIFYAGLITERTWINRFFASKCLVLLGNASFAFYLVHISYINIKIREIWLGSDRNFVILWTLSILLYWTIENPIYHWTRNKLNKK